jgi:hypothetical protein
MDKMNCGVRLRLFVCRLPMYSRPSFTLTAVRRSNVTAYTAIVLSLIWAFSFCSLLELPCNDSRPIVIANVSAQPANAELQTAPQNCVFADGKFSSRTLNVACAPLSEQTSTHPLYWLRLHSAASYPVTSDLFSLSVRLQI